MDLSHILSSPSEIIKSQVLARDRILNIRPISVNLSSTGAELVQALRTEYGDEISSCGLFYGSTKVAILFQKMCKNGFSLIRSTWFRKCLTVVYSFHSIYQSTALFLTLRTLNHENINFDGSIMILRSLYCCRQISIINKCFLGMNNNPVLN